MPTKRTIIERPALPDEERIVQALVTGEGHASLEVFDLSLSEVHFEILWERLGDEILAAWIRERPGTRPWAWWRFDAPPPELTERGEDLEAVPMMRRRVGGSGSTCGDPRQHFGIAPFLDMFDPPRPDALPLFESEAAYLRRHELFARGEERRVAESAFEPEELDVDDEELAEMWDFLARGEFDQPPPLAAEKEMK